METKKLNPRHLLVAENHLTSNSFSASCAHYFYPPFFNLASFLAIKI